MSSKIVLAQEEFFISMKTFINKITCSLIVLWSYTSNKDYKLQGSAIKFDHADNLITVLNEVFLQKST